MMARRLTAWLAMVCLGGCATSLAVREAALDEAAIQSMKCLAVAPFANHTEKKNAGDLVAQEIASVLLTSERFNVIAPSEVQQLLRIMNVPEEPMNTTTLAERYGGLLGVQGVLVGSVLEFDHKDLTPRTSDKEPVVGFIARLVDVQSGRVVWTTTASNYDHQILTSMPQTQQRILHQAVEHAVSDLVSARNGTPAGRGLCATAYAMLQRGEKPDSSAVAEVIHLKRQREAEAAHPKPLRLTTVMLTTPTAPGAAGDPSKPSTRPTVPALPPMADSSGAALPELPSMSDSPGAGLPPLPGVDDLGAMPALPDLGADLPPLAGTLPPLGDFPTPAGDASGDLGGLPALPDAGASPAETASPARARGRVPQEIAQKLKGAVKRFAKKLYRKNPSPLPASLPRKATAKVSLHPKTKRSLNRLAVIMMAAPEMRIRLDVHIDNRRKSVTDDLVMELSERHGQLMVDYLFAKFGLDPGRVTRKGFGRTKPIKKKRGHKKNTRVEVAVLRY